MAGQPRAAAAGDDQGSATPSASAPSWHPPRAVDSPFRVLGIALVAEEVGKGARTVFRYPAQPPPASSSGTARNRSGGDAGMATASEQDPWNVADPAGASSTNTTSQPRASAQDNSNSNNSSNNEEEAAGLFFSLPDRTVAKLFRPKPALCGQPMTLSVGGTVFCCRAVLLPASTFGASAAAAAAGTAGDGRTTPSASAGAGVQSPPRRESAAPAASSASAADPRDGDAEAPSSSAAAGSPNQLVLFSVIVALSPVKGYALTFRDGDERTSGSGATCTTRRGTPTQQSSPKLSSRRGRGKGKGKGDVPSASAADHGGDGLGSSSFLAIRRIHVSLSRLCRVLEREERRCSYVSAQSAAFLKIASEIKEGPGGSAGGGGGASTSATGRSSGGGGGGGGPDAGPSPGSTATGKGGPSDGEMSGAAPPKQVARPRHVRMGSNATAISIPTTPMTLNNRGVSTATTDTSRMAVDHSAGVAKGGGGSGKASLLDKNTEQELRQAIIELLFAYSDDAGEESALPDDGGLYSAQREGQRLIHGNLARELAQVFHALSRNDGNSVFFPTPSSLLSSRDGIVYINRHIAVPIEPASGFSNAADCFSGFGLNRSPTAYDLDVSIPQAVVRPYHTLLFPHAPPAELANAMSHDHPGGNGGSDGTGIPTAAPASFHSQRLQRLLLMANPSKSLADIAVDAALSVPVTLQLAGYLVESGTCTLAHVATRSARYAVSSAGIDRIRSLALPFSQTFGRAVPIFLAVAALTSSGSTLGEILSSASSRTDENGIGRRIASSKAAAGRAGTVQKEQKELSHQSSRSAAAIGRPRGGSLGNDMLSPPVTGGPDKKSDLLGEASIDDIEDELYDMCLWLRAHGVIIELREYLAQVEPTKANSEAGAHGASSDDASKEESDQSAHKVKTISTEEFLTSWNTESRIDKNNSSARSIGETGETPMSQEEVIFRELLEIGDCLTGTTSTVALQWKYGLDTWRLRKLKDWGTASGKLATIHRVPCPGDDWGAP